MTIQLKKFGNMLISRPAGREAWLAAKAYLLEYSNNKTVEVDFSGVDVLAPSWADEFLTKLVAEKGADRVSFTATENPSVQATLDTLKLS